MEKVVPADQAKVLRQRRENQTAPVVAKPHASVENSSAEETKDVDGEKIGGPPYSELTPATPPVTMGSPAPEAHDAHPAEKREFQNDANSNMNEKQDYKNSVTRDEPQSSSPGSNAAVMTRDVPAAAAAPVPPSNPKTAANEGEGIVSSPAYSSGNTVAPETTVAKDLPAPQQQRETGDADVIMAEAPPIAPVPPSEQSKGQEGRNENQLPVSLPPPPPRATQSPTAVGVGRSQSNAAAAVPNEGPPWLLPPLQPRFQGKKCLVLDLDETLVHSSFKVGGPFGAPAPRSFFFLFFSVADVEQTLHQADFTIPVEIEGQYHNVYVIKRPGVDQFMKRVGELYEVVVFTASVSKVSSTTTGVHDGD